MCSLLVSRFLTEITQQIHSLRASGVMSSHFARATESEIRTFRKSRGALCTAPGEIAFLFMDFILLRYAVRDQKLEIHMDDYGVNQACGLFRGQVLDNSSIVISGRAPTRMGKPVIPMPRFM